MSCENISSDKKKVTFPGKLVRRRLLNKSTVFLGTEYCTVSICNCERYKVYGYFFFVFLYTTLTDTFY